MNNENMERIQAQFAAFCTKVLKNERAKIYNEDKKRRETEKSLNEITVEETFLIATSDKYFSKENTFQVLGKPIIVTNNLLAKAISELPKEKQDVILLFYFLEMNDREIGDVLNLVRQSISKRRNATLPKLREYLEKEGFKWID